MVFFFLWFITASVYQSHLGILEKEMVLKLNLMEHSNGPFASGKKAVLQEADRKFFTDISHVLGQRITVVDRKGKVVYDSDVRDISSMDNHRDREEIMNAMESGRGRSIRYSDTLGIDMLYVAKLSGDYIIRIAKPLYDINSSLTDIRYKIIISGIMAGIISIILVIYFSNKISRPIGEAINFAQIFSNGDFSKRIMNYSDDDIGTLQKSLNKLADTIVGKINSLLLEQKKLELTIDSIHDGIALIDTGRWIQIMNASFRRILDIDTDSARGVYFQVIRSSPLNAIIELSLESGQPGCREITLLNGTSCEILIIPISDYSGIQGILLSLHDITERKKIDEIKADLIGNMSHELKTPVAILKGYLETMGQYLGDRKMSMDILGKAIANVDRQNTLINDILKLNRLEKSHDFYMEKINLAEVVETCISLLKPKADNINLEITSDIRDLDRLFSCNRFLAEEVIFNIVDNAINYNTRGGKINIRTAESDSLITLEIRDTGIGIPRESLDRIFERFYRVDKSRSRDTGGTGLGLSIVKHAAELLKWTIDAQSDINGTSFFIRIKTA